VRPPSAHRRSRTSAWLPLTAVGALALLASVRATASPETPIPPAPTRFATDEAGFLSEPVRAELDARLVQFERDSSHQVLLWIGRTTGGVPIEDWASRAFAAWRVGRKGLDDGVVLFIMGADRKLRIEVGYGLEDRLPDARAARIIREGMVPRLAAGDRDGAARAGIDGILVALGGAPAGPHPVAGAPAPRLGWGTLLLLGLLGAALLGFLITHPAAALLLLTTFTGGRNRGGGWGGGGWGGGGWGGGGWGGGGGGFSGGGGRSGGGGASGSW
jgi:uncharacterized protein